MDAVEVLSPAVPTVPPQEVEVEETTTTIEPAAENVIEQTDDTPAATSAEPQEEQSPVAATSPGFPSPPLEAPRSEKRESRLPLPGSRLPLRKSSNPSLAPDNSSTITPTKTRMALPTPRLQTGSLRRPSAGVSPVRSPGGLSPGLKSQSSNGSLKSPSPATPTRIALPRSPVGPSQRSVSTTAVNTPRSLQKPSTIPTTRRASGLPTITKTPSRDTLKSVSATTTPIAARTTPQPTPQPKKTPTLATPRIQAARRSLSAYTPSADSTPSKSPVAAARTPLRVRSFQSPANPVTTPKATISTPQPKPVSATPRPTIKLAKRPVSKPAPPPVDAEPLDKRQRAAASSQALREQIKAARAARRDSDAAAFVNNGFKAAGGGGGGGGGSGGSNWPEIIIAGVDDKKPEDEEEDRELGSDEDDDDFEHPLGAEEAPKSLTVRPGGILDLTSKKMDEFTEETLGETDTLMVKVLLLQRNTLTIFSPVIKSFRGLYTLDLSCNCLKGDNYLTLDMEFPYLKTLLLHGNSIDSLDPVTEHIDAPRLNYLDVHANRLKSYPSGLSKKFQSLLTFVASDNKIEDVDVEALEGVEVVDLMNNCIASLPPKLGLLGDRGLRELRLGGNLFRVPRRQLLDKGTEAVLEWLRERIPVEEVKDSDDEDDQGYKNGEGEVKEEGWDVVGRDDLD
ncbi:hypothetical protein H072_4832 [Dactylellina haptotyla CBS 200.50]|uniref:Uncharacterized protein n=1 Tax=Dactylellina haptotyla (strain CBS 200.50) TaxID=1284197 RepID=S8AEF0_DACHA|nr:hypothetical protein H072_4832 [Dactylellina haptotyla CBS 200.50]